MYYTERVIRWKLQETMTSADITRYALQRKSGVSMNTIRNMYDGKTEQPNLGVLSRVLNALRQITGQELGLDDVLEFLPDTAA